jgi:hypothetical protein
MKYIKKFPQIFENQHKGQIKLTSSELGDSYYNFSGDLTIDFNINFLSDNSGSVSSEFWEFDFQIDDGEFNIKSKSSLPKRIVLQKIVDEIDKVLNS